LLVFICLTSFTSTYAGGSGQGAAVHTLVIDPGHGGMDPGAIGPGGHHEADLALAVSLKFGEMVKQAFPDVKIIYTRTTDKFVSLADRADMANKAKADLFICIHLNSATNHDAYGTSTYVLGLHRTDDNLEIAKRENAVIELEGDKDKNYEFDPNSPEGHIIMSMKQNAFLDQSILIASKIEDELAVLSKRKSRGVKQAGFWVLYKTAMPSLLAEIGFVSNPSEETYLSTDAGQTNIATSIFKAFRSYKLEIEGTKDTATAHQPAAEKKTEVSAPNPNPVVKPAPSVASTSPSKKPENPKPTADNTKPQSQDNPPSKKEIKLPADTSLSIATVAKADTLKSAPKGYKPIDQVASPIIDTTSRAHESTEPKTEKKPVLLRDDNTADLKPSSPQDNTVPKESVKERVKEPVKKADPVVVKKEPEPKPVVKKEPTQPVSAPATKESVYFTVQLFAAKHKPTYYDDLVNTFGMINREEIADGLVRYMAGEFPTYSQAKKALEIAHSKGIKDAFIVGYVNKRRLDGKSTLQLGVKYP